MILHALHQYYERLAPDNMVPEFGFSMENVGFVLEIDKDGKLLQVNDIRQGEGAKMRPVLMEIPYTNKVNVRANNVEPNFLIDKAAYLFGNDKKTKAKRLPDCYKSFVSLVMEVLGEIDDKGGNAVLKFYKKWNPTKAPKKLQFWDDITSDKAGFIAWRLDGERDYIHLRPKVKEAWQKYLGKQSSKLKCQCMITGSVDTDIQQLHAQFKGITGGQSSGKSLVSFNIKSAESYGKEQSFNAPVSVKAEFKSSTALKHLIRNEAQHLYIGDTYTVFWTERNSPVEDFFGLIMNPRDTSTADNKELAVFLESVSEGKLPADYEPNIPFYVLGLSPNAARLSVRFWHVSTVKDISEKLGQHFRDLSIIRSFDSDPVYPGMWRLLRETSNQKSREGPPPLLAGAVMQSILKGTPYPQTLLSTVIGRIRAEQNINYMKAAIIKAVLIRKYRTQNKTLEISMALNKENKNEAYLLGRLFAVLEKAQQDAIPGANATIKDRYYGSASATPKAVFPQLLRLAQHHITKAEYGRVRDKLIEEIICDIKNFPAHLTIDGQGLFAIGYYHQRQDFYKKKDNKTNKEI